MTDRFWLCLGCGVMVHIEYFFTHVNFHERSGTSAEFKQIDE